MRSYGMETLTIPGKLNNGRAPKYSLEGYSIEHQHLRIIFAPENDAMVVVTATDLINEWPRGYN